ncbi:alpha-amylase family glycosyl hydrolase [Nocardioides acrostichi]|uniref:alpha-amylase family glycosyl hydrolase n=1 Tax=Nocardioides acrostichi TaxID=2784339 RepID=UPI002E286F68|nr:alpha-amylase family glycosyl hydrolase [Nocardioides acrostichi]
MTRVPTSTYRVQVTAAQDLFRVVELLDYLHDLGADWVYLSPVLEAEPGSDHGYDVIAHDRVDPDRGGAKGLAAVSTRARELGMGVLVDIVPNHMGVATPRQNTWWWTLLEMGPGSARAAAFDIDWAAGDGKIRIPVLGSDSTDDVEVDVDAGEVRYYEHVFPLAPGTTTLAEQHYELVGWQRADHELNYRRFFAVNTLAAVKVELPEVFADSHSEIARWFDDGLVDGLRVDHPDGLHDPRGYLDDLAEVTGGAYVLVEKILEPGEELPTTWATQGTTGYDALALVDRVLVDPAGQAPLDELESRLRGLDAPLDWHAMIHDRKRDVADTILGSEVRRIVRELPPPVVEPGGAPATSVSPVVEPGGAPATSVSPVVEPGGAPATSVSPVVEPGGAPATSASPVVEPGGAPATSVSPVVEPGGAPATSASPVVEPGGAPATSVSKPVDAVAELLACFPVYRSYLRPDDADAGRAHLDEAFAAARAHRPDLAATLEALEPVLGDPAQPAARRFQQTSGMVMAKGVEDCSFYRFSRLTSLNEVGGDPSDFALDVAGFHAAMAHRQATTPHAMTALSTHDTKRGEDVRARIHVLAETPRHWIDAVDQLLTAAPIPDAGFAHLLWQAVLGVWGSDPDDVLRERLHGYAMKAMREAGEATTWTAPEEDFEAAVHSAVDAAFDDRGVRDVLDTMLGWVSAPGWVNALSAKLLALTMPGVPDVYQGSELVEQSLVDPDNRRPVDFEHLARVLAGESDDVRGAKLRVTAGALRLRRDRPELFTGYDPVGVTGEAADHAVAFDRGGAITVVTRLPLGLNARGGWGGTHLDLPPGRWRDALTGRGHTGPADVADVLADHPVALLVEED